MNTNIKVVFLFGGTPHYYNAILNLLQQVPGYCVAVVSPKSKSRTFGEGIHQSTEGIEFEHIQLEEIEEADGTLAFAGLAECIDKMQPAIIVSVLPYLNQLYANTKVAHVLQRNRIKVILKDHPFRLSKYDKSKKDFGLYFYPKAVRTVRSLIRRGVPRPLVAPFAKAAVTKRRWDYRKLIAEQLRSQEQRAELFRSPDALVCYVDEAFEIFESYGVARERVFITRNSPDTRRWFAAESRALRAGSVKRKPFRILHVGRLVEWKRVDLLLRAFKLVLEAFPGAELDIVGYGPMEDTWKAEADNLGIASNVTFSGGVYGEDNLARHFMEASVFVMAGMGGLSINDAMCFRLPVVCSVCDGTEKHLVFEGVNGRYFREGDEQDLARKLVEMFEDLDGMEKMGMKSREIVESKVNEQTVTAGYQRAFEYVTGIDTHDSSRRKSRIKAETM